MYKLLALDLDGTLVNDDAIIPDNNKNAIKKAIDKGVKVCLSSGRSYLSLKYFEQELCLNEKGNYGICFNGSILYETHNHNILRDVRLPKGMAINLIKELSRFKADTIVYVNDMLYILEMTPSLKYYTERSKVNYTIVDSFEKIETDVSKVLIRGENDELKKANEYMSEYTKGLCNCFFTEKTLLEFTNLNATKGNALKELYTMLGLKKEEVIAVGDNFNDISMIEEVGLGIAVNNAENRVKEIANYVTEWNNNQGAIEEVIHKFL